MKSGLVSILMPAYNGAEFIRQAIDSVITQTYPAWELVVVDDGSTDTTAAVVATYQDPRIRYVFQANRGQAAALNRGLELAEGEFVTTLDVDDWLTVDSLQDRVEYLVQHPEHGVVYGDGFYCDVTGRALMRFSEHRIGAVTGDVYSMLICTPFFGTGANVLVRRAVLDRYRIRYDESIVWCQDHDIYVRIAEVATFGVVATPTVWYRLHAANMTMTMAGPQRVNALVATRLKIMRSPRFVRLSADEKARFFDNVLNQELSGRVTEQLMFIDSAQFRSLPRRKQARVLQLATHIYLVWGVHSNLTKRLLYWAWLCNPLEPRTVVLLAMAHLNPRLVQYTVQFWRRLRHRDAKPMVSPFEIVKNT